MGVWRRLLPVLSVLRRTIATHQLIDSSIMVRNACNHAHVAPAKHPEPNNVCTHMPNVALPTPDYSDV